MRFGTVYLVGAGPGDAGLLTLRGKALLEQADGVVYDALLNDALLAFAPANAERVYVGKKAGQHSLGQADINRILIDLASRHARIVRLKGGDPYVFGRGGEEALALREAGIPFEVVPGVTAMLGAAAHAGIPVTHRGLARNVLCITGHVGAGDEEPDIHVDALRGVDTIVVYMGQRNLAWVVSRIAAAGRPPDTPAALVESATTPRQRVVAGTLGRIVADAEEAALEAPSLLIVGAVACLRESLAWREALPLSGARIAVTHTETMRGRLETVLEGLGAQVFSFPTVAIAPIESADAWPPLHGFDWIILTSPNAANALFAHIDALGLDVRALAGMRLCPIGARVVETVAARGLRPDAAPAGYDGAAVLAATGPVAGLRMLLPRADLAQQRLPKALREAGAEVVESAAYRRIAPPKADSEREALARFDPQAILFTNAAAARYFPAASGAQLFATLAATCVAGSIGPSTSRALGEIGMPLAIEAATPTVESLADAVAAWWRDRVYVQRVE